jgi:signal peptidase complex subunit 2
VRLSLGYTAFAICAATFYWDYRLGFESTKLYTTIAVILYSLINGLLTFWIWAVEKGAVYMGTSPSGEKIQISSSTKKHAPKYRLLVKTTSKDGKVKEQKIERSFTEWFDAAGHFVTTPFQQMFASNVEVIGKADPKNVVKKEKKVKAPVDDGKTMDEKWASLLAESSGVSPAPIGAESTATPGKGTKRRGKKA